MEFGGQYWTLLIELGVQSVQPGYNSQYVLFEWTPCRHPYSQKLMLSYYFLFADGATALLSARFVLACFAAAATAK